MYIQFSSHRGCHRSNRRLTISDGGKQALTEWHYSGNTAPKKKRNKKKKSTAGDSTTQLNGHVPSTELVPNGIVPNGKVPVCTKEYEQEYGI